jgi:hypothetical protein
MHGPFRAWAGSRDNALNTHSVSTPRGLFVLCRRAVPKGASMAAMKPRTGDGPLEVTKEGRGIVMRVPLEGGGRLVVELSADEAGALGDALKSVVS